MVEINIGKNTFSDDVALGEIVEVKASATGTKSWVLVYARVVANNGQLVKLSLLDLPRTMQTKNAKAMQKLLAMMNAQFN